MWCARVCVLLYECGWLPHPLGCSLSAIALGCQPVVAAGVPEPQDGDCEHWSQETPGLLLQSGPSSLPSLQGLKQWLGLGHPAPRVRASSWPAQTGWGLVSWSGLMAVEWLPHHTLLQNLSMGPSACGLEHGQLRASSRKDQG